MSDRFFKKAKEREAELESIVYVEGGSIIINVHHEYDIALGRCDTHEKILAWTLHLAEKTWMTKDVLERFIQLAMSENGLKAHLPGS